MLKLDELKKKVAAIDLKAEARKLFGISEKEPGPREFFAEASSGVRAQKAGRAASLRERAAEVSSRQIIKLAERAQEKLLPAQESGKAGLEDAVENERGPRAVWNAIASKHITGTFYILGLDMGEDRTYYGIEKAREAARTFISYMKDEQPEAWDALKKMFAYCEQNNAAVHIELPKTVEGVPYGYKSIYKKPQQLPSRFHAVKVTVSPLDPHYEPLTISRQKESARHDKDASYWFNDTVRSALHESNMFVRAFTGRSYRP